MKNLRVRVEKALKRVEKALGRKSKFMELIVIATSCENTSVSVLAVDERQQLEALTWEEKAISQSLAHLKIG
ncbi:hypothetical protein AX14_003169 [Amanita brunnescens Koide BX004]|nr:hypothetical protein AX14_003169 [Amanita brunnescens Koide BX004]